MALRLGSPVIPGRHELGRAEGSLPSTVRRGRATALCRPIPTRCLNERGWLGSFTQWPRLIPIPKFASELRLFGSGSTSAGPADGAPTTPQSLRALAPPLTRPARPPQRKPRPAGMRPPAPSARNSATRSFAPATRSACAGGGRGKSALTAGQLESLTRGRLCLLCTRADQGSQHWPT
jgi:hypothetical protein